MAEPSTTLPPGVEPEKKETDRVKTEDDVMVDRFQMTLDERRKHTTKTARGFKDIISGVWLERKGYDSPFPRRDTNTYANWFVDGEDYMMHAANMISLAREEIFITDWWLSPQVYLKRPAGDRYWRFDELLKRKADEGVKIYIQLFKELEMAMGTIKSLESKRILHKLHPNIKVIRHPDRISGVVFWSHHEKLLIIDQNIAYVGGLDFAFGRWDTNQHPLADLGPMELRGQVSPTQSAPMEDLAVSQVSTDNGEGPSPFSNGLEHLKDPYSASFEQSSDVGNTQNVTQPAISGDNATDNLNPQEAVHHVRKMYHKRKERRHERHDENVFFEEGWTDLDNEDFHRRRSAPPDATIFIGKDYVNFIEKNFVDLDKPEEDFVDRNLVPRMPWHDIHCVVYGAAARDLAEHFVIRWNATKATKKKLADWPGLAVKNIETYVPTFLRKMSFPCRIQVLRSACDWSVPGLAAPEDSIHAAYCDMIGNAKHYIYIENQFFVSLMDSDNVTNHICHALCDRIVRAYEEQEPLKVYIVIPLLPNFEGKIGEESGSSLLAVMRWTYDSLCREPHSLFFNLKKRGVSNPHKYVSVCSLRTHDKLPGKLVTELIYIHSKLMIVDDKQALIGSANINDRSQLGTRDSEIAVHIHDLTTEPAKMNNHPFKAGRFAASLRKHIFKEHLGDLNMKEPADPQKYIPVDVTDPGSDEFFEGTWKRIAKKNTEIFEEVFHCMPTNSVSTFDELPVYKAQPTLAQIDKMQAAVLLREIQGHLVEFPMAFLNRTDLAPSIKSKEGLVPYQIFT